MDEITCDRCAHPKTSHRLGMYRGESEGKCIVVRCRCEAYITPAMRAIRRAKGHNHEYTRSKPSASVETCACGKWRHTENSGPSIIGI